MSDLVELSVGQSKDKISTKKLSEVFDAARHAEHITRSISLYRSNKGFGDALGIDAAPEGVRR